MNLYIDLLYKFLVSNRTKVILSFKVLYSFLTVVLIVAIWSTYSVNDLSIYTYDFAVFSGKIALILFVIALFPGMMKRFGYRHKFISILTIFRRYIGILMYIFVLIHFVIIRLLPQILSGAFVLPPLFELFGTLANILLFILFVTSNDLSVRKLGRWWYILQRGIYIIMWLVFLHVALQKISLWSILMCLTLIGMIASFITNYFRNQQITPVN